MNTSCASYIRLFVEDKYTGRNGYIFVGCGSCPLCMAKRARQWTFRLNEEMKSARDAYFITLTYNDENFPKKGDNGLSNTQKFWKILRHRLGKYNTDFKYFLVSELGGEHGRLHYHALVFNTDLNRRSFHSLCENAWGRGFVSTNYLTPGRTMYVSKHCLGKINSKRYDKKVIYRRGYRIEYKVRRVDYWFMRCSHGIGIGFLSPGMISYICNNKTGTIKIDRNTEISIPSYYIEKIKNINPDAYEEIKINRLKHAFEEYENMQHAIREDYERHRDIAKGLPYYETNLDFITSEVEVKCRRILKKAKEYNFEVPPQHQK